MGFAVFHASKGKGSGSSLGGHIDRKPEQAHTFKNADPAKLSENKVWQGNEHTKMPLHEAVKARIKTGYTGTKAIRKDAVRYVPMVLTGSHEDMKRIASDSTTMDSWIAKNFDFVKTEFGRENILRFAVHMDEKTPHIHAVIVPLKDGKLTAKTVLGDRDAMSARQTRYADQMKEFGLNRGIVGSKKIHNSEGWYLGQQKQEQEEFLSHLPEFSIIDRLSPSRYIENALNVIKLASKKSKDFELTLKTRSEQLKWATQDTNRKEKEIVKLQEKLDITNKKISGRFLNPSDERELAAMQRRYQPEQQRDESQGRTKTRGRGM